MTTGKQLLNRADTWNTSPPCVRTTRAQQCSCVYFAARGADASCERLDSSRRPASEPGARWAACSRRGAVRSQWGQEWGFISSALGSQTFVGKATQTLSWSAATAPYEVGLWEGRAGRLLCVYRLAELLPKHSLTHIRDMSRLSGPNIFSPPSTTSCAAQTVPVSDLSHTQSALRALRAAGVWRPGQEPAWETARERPKQQFLGMSPHLSRQLSMNSCAYVLWGASDCVGGWEMSVKFAGCVKERHHCSGGGAIRDRKYSHGKLMRKFILMWLLTCCHVYCSRDNWLMAPIRKTYGWHHYEDVIPLSTYSTALNLFQ